MKCCYKALTYLLGLEAIEGIALLLKNIAFGDKDNSNPTFC